MLLYLKDLMNNASNLTIVLLVLISLTSIYVFVKVFKSDFQELD